jgi:hypothetical protein
MRDAERPVQPAGGRTVLAVALLGAALTLLIGVWPSPFLRSVRGLEPAASAAVNSAVATPPRDADRR